MACCPLAGRLQDIDDLRKGTTRYIYDQIDRLKAVEGYASEQFDFDPAGNILSGIAQTTREQASNVGAGNRLRFHGDRHFHYDERGNLIEEHRGKNGAIVTRYQYNKQNQLVQVEKDGQTFDYTYDPLGRRVRKQDAFGATEFLWNGDVLLCEQRNHAQKVYLYEPGSFRPLAFVERNQVYFYHLDHLGTPQEMTDWEGRVVWSARYRVYGNVLKQDVETVENNLRFQGQYFDAETGLHYNRFRYYDPGTGQFTQQDPIGLLGGINNYQYAPNPTGWVDPLGLVCKELTSWNQFQKDTKGHFANSTEAAKSYNRMKEVQAMDKGARPDPSTYLPQTYIDAHLQKFEGGASYLVPKDILDTYGRNTLGMPDNTQFVMPSKEMDDLLKKTGGNIALIEKELGIPEGAWQGRQLTRISISDPKDLDLRMATGNEMGANEKWLAGGHLPTGYSEAIVNKIDKSQYIESDI